MNVSLLRFRLSLSRKPVPITSILPRPPNRAGIRIALAVHIHSDGKLTKKIRLFDYRSSTKQVHCSILRYHDLIPLLRPMLLKWKLSQPFLLLFSRRPATKRAVSRKWTSQESESRYRRFPVHQPSMREVQQQTLASLPGSNNNFKK